MAELPRIISVDDHVVEPATLWSDRLPALRGCRRRASCGPPWARSLPRRQADGEAGLGGQPDRLVYYEGAEAPLLRVDSASACHATRSRCAHHLRGDAARSTSSGTPRGHGHEPHRGVAVLPTFPPSAADVPRGEGPRARAALRRAYNDWMVEQWCGRATAVSSAHPHPPVDAGSPPTRCAATPRAGSTPCASARSRPSSPPSVHDRTATGPVLRRCAETETVVNMHIGSSSKMPRPRVTPAGGGVDAHHTNATFSLVDYCSRLFVRFPTLRIAYSEARSAGSLHLGAGRHVWRRPGLGRVATRFPTAVVVLRDHVWAASSTTPTACAASRRSASTTSPTSGLPHRTRPAPHRQAGRAADGLAHRGAALQGAARHAIKLYSLDFDS